jgi:hypothetical protein
MIAKLEEFASLYERRPLQDNAGGMLSPHLFLFWYVLQNLMPEVVIESGVWRGQGTWFIEQACPKADIYCIDINWKNLAYRSPRAKYLDRDFATHEWGAVPKEKTLLFLDDHSDAMARCRQANDRGFRHLLFEDNYPPPHGDCYSLKKAFLGAGYQAPRSARAVVGRLLGRRSDRTVAPNQQDAMELKDRLVETYEELPPIFKTATTRWGDPWDDRYPTTRPLLTTVARPFQQVFLDEARDYTFMCYVRLKG